MSVKKEKLSEQPPDEESSDKEHLEKGEDFSEPIKYTIPVYITGLLAGFFLDFQRYQRSPLVNGS